MNKLKNAIVIALTVAFTGLLIYDTDGSEYDGPVVSNTGRKHRRGAFGERVYKLFEFAPTDGVGMTEVCPTPNWLYVSEDVVGTGWGTAGSAITATVDYALGPDNLMSADRLQIPAIPANGESVRFTSASESVNPATFSAMIKGNGTSGTVDFFTGSSGYTCISCAYNPTTWTECSVTRDYLSGSAYGYIGNESIGVVGCPSGTGAKDAHDILVWGFKLNAGTTRGVYTKTTGAATVQQPTTAKGQSLIVSRGSQAYCNSNIDATATIGLLTGSMIKYPNNTIRVERGSNGIKAFRAEHAINNFMLSPEAIGAPDWTISTSVAGFTSTADTTKALDGLQTAETLRIPATSGAGYSVIWQLSAAILPNPVCSVYVTAVAPLDGGVAVPGTFDISCGGTCTPCTYTADGKWTKCSSYGPAGSSTQYMYIGNYSQVCGVARVAQDVAVWHAQMEYGPNATSPIVASTTRNVDVVRYDLGVSAPPANTMCVAGAVSGKPITSYESYTGVINVASASMGDPSGKGMWLYSPSTAGSTIRCIAMDDAATLYNSGTVAGSSGTADGYCSISGNTVVGSWAGASMTASGAISGGTWSPARYITLAGQSSGAVDGLKYGFVVDTAVNGCQ